jgi:galactose mutarotase-like enzyme
MDASAPRFGQHRNHDCRLRKIVWRGRRCVSIENETVRMLICADKGADILKLTHKPSDTEMLHQAPAGLPSSHYAQSSPLAAGSFRDLFPGGWYLMLPNGPVPCTHRGAEHGQHGEATFLAWDVVVDEDRAERVTITFHTRLRRTPLSVERRFTVERHSGTITLDECVTSEAAHAIEILWGQHPTFGAPLIEAGTRIDLPAGARWSTGADPACSGSWPVGEEPANDLGRVPDEGVDLHDFTRVSELSAGWFAVSNERRGAGIALRWDETLFPVLGVWRMLGGEGNYPWYGARRMIALEPACDLPSLAQAASRGTAIVLAPGQTAAARWEVTLFTPRGTVTDLGWGGAIRFEGEGGGDAA